MDFSLYLTYVVACVALILVPGPSQALVISRALSNGARAGVVTAIGLNIGTMCHAIAAALGLAAVLASSAAAFNVVKFVGALYLIGLGIQTFRSQRRVCHSRVAPLSTRASFWQAVVVGVLNPKVALFFVAFLPQFINTSLGSVFLQFVVLGATMAVLDTIYESGLVAVVCRANLSNNKHFATWRARLSGSVLIGLGAHLALEKR